MLQGLRAGAQLQSLVLTAGPRPACIGARPARIIRCFGFGSHMSDNDPEYIEKMKERALKGKVVSHDPETPGWCEGLASDSEAVIKAERDPELPVEQMREFTTKVLMEEEEKGQYDATGGITEPKSGAMGN